MLTIGLCTEAVIFFFSAFEPCTKKWTGHLYIRNLPGFPKMKAKLPAHAGSGKHRGGAGGGFVGGGAGSAALAKFDEMLEKAEITPDLFQKLGGE